jgi:hypothetical protein
LQPYRREPRAGLSILLLVILGACAQLQVIPTQLDEPADALTVAFIGDQGSGPGAREVLNLIKAEGTDLVLHQGDFDYRDNPGAWDALITEVLGAEFPYFASVGNHDVKAFLGPGGYQAKLMQRLGRVPGAQCTGDLGIMSACTYRNLFVVLSGIGTIPKQPDDPAHIGYLRKQLANSRAPWKICSWHKNQRSMQVGSKRDEVGWRAYAACREAGAFIATGHEHSYSRTHLMDNFEAKAISSPSSILRIRPGRSFAFVSGLGGKGVRRQRRGGPWWAAIHTRDQGARHGALFCKFADGARARRASCYFKDIDGAIADRFIIINEEREDLKPGS